jgi:predicted lysophospholipase L1 biosynthesis ABC-type transport system permease subunit
MTQFGISSAWGAVAGSVASVVVIWALGAISTLATTCGFWPAFCGRATASGGGSEVKS